MTILTWLADNWYLIIVAVAFLISFYVFITDKKKVIEWLKWAVSQAEKELGSGTGQIKLRQVYDMFIERFPVFSKFIPFIMFSSWVDTALEFLKDQIEKNNKIKEFEALMGPALREGYWQPDSYNDYGE